MSKAASSGATSDFKDPRHLEPMAATGQDQCSPGNPPIIIMTHGSQGHHQTGGRRLGQGPQPLERLGTLDQNLLGLCIQVPVSEQTMLLHSPFILSSLIKEQLSCSTMALCWLQVYSGEGKAKPLLTLQWQCPHHTRKQVISSPV